LSHVGGRVAFEYHRRLAVPGLAVGALADLI
jgi:hypothetical protein